MTVGLTSFSFPVLKAGVIIVLRVLHCSPLASLSIEFVMLSLSIVCKRKKNQISVRQRKPYTTFSYFCQCNRNRKFRLSLKIFIFLSRGGSRISQRGRPLPKSPPALSCFCESTRVSSPKNDIIQTL